MANKEFWKKLKPFLTKDVFLRTKIGIEVNDGVVSYERILT